MRKLRSKSISTRACSKPLYRVSLFSATMNEFLEELGKIGMILLHFLHKSGSMEFFPLKKESSPKSLLLSMWNCEKYAISDLRKLLRSIFPEVSRTIDENLWMLIVKLQEVFEFSTEAIIRIKVFFLLERKSLQENDNGISFIFSDNNFI